MGSAKNMIPVMNIKDSSHNNNRFVLFEIIPVGVDDTEELVVGEDVYVRNKESGLYLAAEDKMLHLFSSVIFLLFS